jgi:hypothetical protein
MTLIGKSIILNFHFIIIVIGIKKDYQIIFLITTLEYQGSWNKPDVYLTPYQIVKF